jgi:hypothetical protein
MSSLFSFPLFFVFQLYGARVQDPATVAYRPAVRPSSSATRRQADPICASVEKQYIRRDSQYGSPDDKLCRHLSRKQSTSKNTRILVLIHCSGQVLLLCLPTAGRSASQSFETVCVTSLVPNVPMIPSLSMVSKHPRSLVLDCASIGRQEF